MPRAQLGKMSVHKQLIARVITATVLIASMLTLGGCFLFNNLHAQFIFDPAFDYPPLTVHFDASASSSPNGAIVFYTWDFDDGSTDTGESVDHTFYDKGTYAVTLTVTDSSGAVGAITHNVKALNHFPHPEFTVVPSSLYIPKGEEATFDGWGSYDEDGSIVDWVWSFGDGVTGTGPVVQHVYIEAGSQGILRTVTLTVIDNDGASNTTQKTIRVVGCDTCH